MFESFGESVDEYYNRRFVDGATLLRHRKCTLIRSQILLQ